MADKPILFKAEMVKAIMDGRKTQTRRVIKSPPTNGWEYTGDYGMITSKHPKRENFHAPKGGRQSTCRKWLAVYFWK